MIKKFERWKTQDGKWVSGTDPVYFVCPCDGEVLESFAVS